MSTSRKALTRGAPAAVSGVLSGYTALAVAELAASLLSPRTGPVTAVGGAAIDATPAAVKDWAIRNFGTNDKLVLQLGILATLAVLAVLLGCAALRWRRAGAAGVLGFGALGAAAALTRPDSAGALDALPSLAGAVAGAAVLFLLIGPLRPVSPPAPRTGAPPVPGAAHPAPGAAAVPGAREAADAPAVRDRAGAPSPASAADVPGAPRPRRAPEPSPANAPAALDPDNDRNRDGDLNRAHDGDSDGAHDRARDGDRDPGRAHDRDGEAPGDGGGRAAEPALVPVVSAASAPRLGLRAAIRTGLRPDLRTGAPGPQWNRRGFVAGAGAVALLSTGAGVLGRALTGRRGRRAAESRAAVRLPAPASPAPAIPPRARLRVAGVTAFTTPNNDFYRVDTALVVPEIDADGWRLRLHGRGVTRPRTYTFRELLNRPLIERDITLTCVSNEVGGPYAGSARWLGVPLAELLREAGVVPPSRGGSADQLVARSVDGMTLGSPVEEVMDGRDAMLAIGMNGEPLPFDHGFPVRMVVPGLYGYVSACKWLKELELTTFDAYDPYWVRRKWARRAPIKTQARIDTPKPFARPAAGPVMVAGVAWAQHRGIRRVELRVDDGPWQEATLAEEHTPDTWRLWSFAWDATPGGHTLTVRATDATGRVQTARRARTVPDGASGRHSVFVTPG